MYKIIVSLTLFGLSTIRFSYIKHVQKQKSLSGANNSGPNTPAHTIDKCDRFHLLEELTPEIEGIRIMRNVSVIPSFSYFLSDHYCGTGLAEVSHNPLPLVGKSYKSKVKLEQKIIVY